jgi:pimeloyl-ACP methyl ester carboxylesterase
MNATDATEIIFLPGFDGIAELRAPFVDAIGAHHPARAIGYPNRKLDTLAGYCRHVSGQVAAESRPIVIAESFAALIAARWAAQDPHVAGVVLCAGFIRSPVPWAALGASLPSLAQFFGANFLNPMALASGDPARRRWSEALAHAIRSLDREVVAERLRIVATEDVTEALRSLRIPVVLLQFDDDLVVGREARGALEAACHNAHVVRFKGPHFAIETRPRESAAAIREPLAALFGKTATAPGAR